MIPPELHQILAETAVLRQAFLVGGCVRDWLLGIPNKDFDIEVFGVSYADLISALARWGRTDTVGRSFGVVKLTTQTGCTYDFTIPRRDSKIAPGHKGFEIEFNPDISPREASARRDFTINSMMYDPRKESLIDFHGGRQDLEKKILRHTSPAFSEDPLRILRGMQFAGRFALRASPETNQLCADIHCGFNELAAERVREEWFKWAAKSTVPSAGLRFLAETGWTRHFPEIQALISTPQDAEWHPEGDVFTHTCKVCDAFCGMTQWKEADETSRIVMMLAALAHDFGKPQTTVEVVKNGCSRITSPGHAKIGGQLAEQFLNRINAPQNIVLRVIPLVVNHMVHLQSPTDRMIRRLARRLKPETIEDLCLVMAADALGCSPLSQGIPANIIQLENMAQALDLHNQAPKPILLGRHLLPLGIVPSPFMGEVLRAAFEAQLNGEFFTVDEALQWLGRQTQLSPPIEFPGKLNPHS
jgi:tRNA nucleotidyltransferase (CCA-adding enzyme)